MLRSSGRVGTGREPVSDGPEPFEIMYVTGQRGHFGHGDLGVQRGEAVTCALFARDHLHPFSMQPQQTRGQLLDGSGRHAVRSGRFVVLGVLLLGGVLALGVVGRDVGGGVRCGTGRGNDFGESGATEWSARSRSPAFPVV